MEIEIDLLRKQKGENAKKLENSALLMIEYVIEIILIIDELEATQMKLKEYHEFLDKFAARKQPYIATDYFEE